MRKTLDRISRRTLKVSSFQMTVRSGCDRSAGAARGEIRPRGQLSMRNFQRNYVRGSDSFRWREAEHWNSQRNADASETLRALAHVSLPGRAMSMEIREPREGADTACEVCGGPRSTSLKRAILDYRVAEMTARQRLGRSRKRQVEPQKRTDEWQRHTNLEDMLEGRLHGLQSSVIR